MNKFIQKYFGLLDRIFFWRWKLGDYSSAVNGKVLMYHHVTDDPSINVPQCTCGVKAFREQINGILDEGYEFVCPDEMMEIIRTKSEKKFALITFDDVPENAYYNAIPFLRDKNIPFTLFITKNYTNTSGYINEQMLLDLNDDSLCTIGAHTVSHPMLRHSSNPEKEIRESKLYLEDLLRKPINYFAYPFGKHSSISRHIRNIAKRQGFKAAFGTIPSTINDYSAKCMFYLPRIVL